MKIELRQARMGIRFLKLDWSERLEFKNWLILHLTLAVHLQLVMVGATGIAAEKQYMLAIKTRKPDFLRCLSYMPTFRIAPPN